jgi:hypothetical protein
MPVAEGQSAYLFSSQVFPLLTLGDCELWPQLGRQWRRELLFRVLPGGHTRLTQRRAGK